MPSILLAGTRVCESGQESHSVKGCFSAVLTVSNRYMTSVQDCSPAPVSIRREGGGQRATSGFEAMGGCELLLYSEVSTFSNGYIPLSLPASTRICKEGQRTASLVSTIDGCQALSQCFNFRQKPATPVLSQCAAVKQAVVFHP